MNRALKIVSKVKIKLSFCLQDASATKYDGSNKWQFNGNRNGGEVSFMLNTDFELYYDLKTDKSGRTTCKLEPSCGLDQSCKPENCRPSKTFGQAHSYSEVIRLFVFGNIEKLQDEKLYKNKQYEWILTLFCRV